MSSSIISLEHDYIASILSVDLFSPYCVEVWTTVSLEKTVTGALCIGPGSEFQIVGAAKENDLQPCYKACGT